MLVLRHPVLRAAIISGTSLSTGDIVCQLIRAKSSGREARVNWRQSLRFGIVGLTLHGPYFFHGFKWLDDRFGAAATLQRALLKSAAGQVTIFPVYVCAFFFYMGILEGRSPEQSVAKVQQAFPAVFASGSVFWPAANMINFMCVPPTKRILFVNAAGLIWNAFLSWQNSTKGALQADRPGGTGGGTAASNSSRKQQ